LDHHHPAGTPLVAQPFFCLALVEEESSLLYKKVLEADGKRQQYFRSWQKKKEV